MVITEVKSKFIKEIGYDRDIKHLRVKIGDKHYDHFDVPEEVYVRFLNSESKGRFYNKNLRGKYV
jgi:hypothetical protein